METNRDSGRHWPLSSGYNGTHKIVSYRPKSKFNTNWGKMELNKLESYLIQNPLTDRGKTHIAAYQGFTKEWNDVKKEHDDAAPISDKIFHLGQLFAEKGSKDGVYLTWSEGMHRPMSL